MGGYEQKSAGLAQEAQDSEQEGGGATEGGAGSQAGFRNR